MNNLREVWSKRFVFYINELQKYLKYIISGHIAIVIVFVIGAAGYTYSEWLNTAPKDFPAFLVVSFIVSILIALSTPVTLMKKADSVYFLPLETKLGEYLKLALTWTFFSSIIVPFAALVVSIPLLTRIAGSTSGEILFFLGAILLWKYWSIQTEFQYRWASNGKNVWVDYFMRMILLFAGFYFLLSGSYLFLLAVVIIQVLYLIAWKRKKAEVPFPFDHFIEVEQARMMRFYRFANYFTDVPHIQGMTKRRKWLDILYKLAPYEQTHTQFYLVLRTFVRTNDYFYLWVRLTALAIVGAIFIPFPIVAIIFTSALSFATVIQLRQSLSSGYEFRMDLLFPIDEGTRKKAINRLIRIIQLIQALFVLVVVVVQAGITLELLLIPIMMIVVSELTIRTSKI